ncbi:nucleoside diphosphate kinase regulator [Aureimonas frigidaquae]|uniref:nucleoside diphosphate kinase regulator n=1 Tax=Aureimonas frigidaquae TaxID=424757 RepID=UPI0007848E87|nr:nucleoside diphosphate kinase regulator [Aureimonas frigidaquae]
MADTTLKSRKPRIAVLEKDFESLTLLANQMLDRMPDVAEDLLAELDRARIVDQRNLKSDTVAMGRQVTFRRDAEPERTIQLVYPAEADINAGRISILTPVGTALLGLKEGQSITWNARDGRQHIFTVLAVSTPAPQAVEPDAVA